MQRIKKTITEFPIKTIDKIIGFMHNRVLEIVERLTYLKYNISPVIRQKGESPNWSYKKTKHPKFLSYIIFNNKYMDTSLFDKRSGFWGTLAAALAAD